MYFPLIYILFLACPSVCSSIRLSICCCGHSNLVFFNLISSRFHIWIASIQLSFKFEYGFCPTNDNQDGPQNGRRLSVSMLWSLLLSHFYQIPINFHIWITSIRLSPKFEYVFCRTSDNQNGRQNGSSLPVCMLWSL